MRDPALPVKLTKHFRDRLQERHGIVLNDEERAQVQAKVTALVDAMPDAAEAESIELVCKLADGRKFTCVYVPTRRAVVTAITNQRTGKHKFRKKILPTLNTWVGESREDMEHRRDLSRRIAIRKRQRLRETKNHRLRRRALAEIAEDEDNG